MTVAPRRSVPPVVLGALSVVACRLLLRELIRTKLRHDVARLNAGDTRPILAAYAGDAVLIFDEGGHRWSGRHVGRARIERFLQEIVRAGLSRRPDFYLDTRRIDAFELQLREQGIMPREGERR